MSRSEKTAVITGAAQGIGEAVAARLARDGHSKMLLIDWQAEKLDTLASRLKEEGIDASTLTVDLTDIHTVTEVVSTALEKIGKVATLVNAAGTTARGGLNDTSVETFNLIYNLNVRSPFFIMQLVIPHMQRGGTVVNICSMLAYGGPPFLLAYSSSKAALVALTRGTANAVKRDGIHVFGINLGWTWTPAEQEVQTKVHGLAEDWAETIGRKQPFGRLLMPEDPAALISFLASDDAAMMTGSIIDLDQYVAGTVDDNPGA
jgi:NAD(P)-dependent dehydrogenase (short-subunit alcohol dehydrogenase family)